MLVSPSAAGRDLEGRVVDVQERAVQAVGLDRPELVELRSALNLLTARLRAAADAPSA